MKVLVTGARSLLGAAVARRLADRGDLVTVFQRRPAGLDLPEVLGSVEDGAAVTRATDGADAVVHLAAKVAPTGAWEAFHAVNVAGTARVVAAASRAGARRFVHVSSPSVAHGGEPLMGAGAAPADPDRARGHYARSKALGELLALEASTGEMPVVALRPHLVWGPGDTQLVGRIVERARDGRLAVVGSGAALIDTTYLDNAADAVVAGLDRAPDLGGRALVVSNGQPRPVREVIDRILACAGLPPVGRSVPAPLARAAGRAIDVWWTRADRQDEPPMTEFLAEQLSTAHWFDQRDTRRALQWEPAVGLDEGFRRLGAWYAAERASR